MAVHQGDGEESDLLRQMLVWNAERERLRYGDLHNSDHTDRSCYLQCDGETPCGRCVSQNITECSYDVPVRQSKEEMRTEIQRLREDQKRTMRILDALSSDNSVDILDRLRNGESPESISRRMENFGSPSTSNCSVQDGLQDMAGSTPCFTVPSTACHSPPVWRLAQTDTNSERYRVRYRSWTTDAPG
jgi:hypothetical protein